jgi:transcriptional accessory protein Tex/SPT6
LEEIRVFGRSLDGNASETLNEFYLKQFVKTEMELKLLEKRKQEIAKKINVTQKLLGSKKKGVTMNAELNELLNLKNLATKKYAKHGKIPHDFIERENFFIIKSNFRYSRIK